MQSAVSADLLGLKAKPYFEKHFVELNNFNTRDVHDLVASLMYDNAKYWALVDCPTRVILKWVATDAVHDAHIFMYLKENISPVLECKSLTWEPFDFFFEGTTQVCIKNWHHFE